MLLIAFISLFVLSGCGDPFVVNLGLGLTPQVYEAVPLYSGPVNSVGSLTEAYIQNTEGLITANSRLSTLCEVYLGEECGS